QPTYWCDLAGASLVRGRPTDLLVALDSAETSLQLQPGLEPATFNRALALERLGLLDFAKGAWQASQQTHSAAGWRDEARNHLAQVERQMRVSEFAITSDDVLRASPDQLAGFLERGLDDVRRVVEDELVPLLGRICTPASRSDCADL